MNHFLFAINMWLYLEQGPKKSIFNTDHLVYIDGKTFDTTKKSKKFTKEQLSTTKKYKHLPVVQYVGFFE